MAYINMGGVYMQKANYHQAISYTLKGKALHEQRNDTLQMAEADRGLGVIYLSLKQYEKAVTHADQVIRVARKYRHRRLLFAGLNNKGVALLHQGRFKEAQRLLDEAYPIARSLGDDNVLIVCLSNLGDLQGYLQHADQVLSIYRQVLVLAQRNHHQDGIATANFGLSLGHFMRKEYPEAQHYLTEARRVAEAHQLQKKLPYVYKVQSALELLDGNIAAFKKMERQRDSVERLLINESVLRNTQELEVKYQSRQQEARITRLSQEKQIQNLQLRQQNTLNYVFLGTIASLMGLGYLFYRNTVSKHIITRHKQKLQDQRIRELEQERQLIAADAVLKGEEQERTRLARDLHDGLGGMLSGIKLSLTHMAGNFILSEADAQNFARTLTQLDQSIQELRRVAHSMMPENLIRFGLREVLRDYCDALGKSTGLPIRFQSFGLEERLEQSTEIILYRITQELLTNVIRHAGATGVLVQVLRHEEHLTLTVEDNGKGFDAQSTGNGVGLGNVRSRVNYLNGQVDVVSSPGAGTSVNIQITL
jgi:signal transduction histidine kinase/Tfp pilus assembly protein PilF